MSHVVTIKTKVRDLEAIKLACSRLALAAPVYGEVKLFAATKTGWQVRPQGWAYPAVCNVESGELEYDNFGGRWGDPAQLDRFLQAYAVEKAKLEARKSGHRVSEQLLQDGSVRVLIQAGA